MFSYHGSCFCEVAHVPRHSMLGSTKKMLRRSMPRRRCEVIWTCLSVPIDVYQCIPSGSPQKMGRKFLFLLMICHSTTPSKWHAHMSSTCNMCKCLFLMVYPIQHRNIRLYWIIHKLSYREPEADKYLSSSRLKRHFPPLKFCWRVDIILRKFEKKSFDLTPGLETYSPQHLYGETNGEVGTWIRAAVISLRTF